MIFKVTLEHWFDGILVATKSVSVQGTDAEEAKISALEVASSLQGGLFRLMRKGRHEVKVTNCAVEE